MLLPEEFDEEEIEDAYFAALAQVALEQEQERIDHEEVKRSLNIKS